MLTEDVVTLALFLFWETNVEIQKRSRQCPSGLLQHIVIDTLFYYSGLPAILNINLNLNLYTVNNQYNYFFYFSYVSILYKYRNVV
jgi:hypothetical protein